MTQLIVLSCLALILSTAFVTAGRAARQTRWQAVGADEKRMIARRFPHSQSVSVVETAGDLFATRASYLGFVRGRS